MMEIAYGDIKLKNLGSINILLGRNGSGKSTALKTVRHVNTTSEGDRVHLEYINPERGGNLQYDASLESAIANDSNWFRQHRQRNQEVNFKQQTIAQYIELETRILRLIEGEKRGNPEFSFQAYIDKINLLLENIEIRRGDSKAFKIYKKGTAVEIEAINISSGESELIALAIECLAFKERKMQGTDVNGCTKILLLDEPDVHLHPDLQVRFMEFIYELVKDSDMRVIIATHSTPLLGAIDPREIRVAFMASGQKEILFREVSAAYENFLPIFGAHPLSAAFNRNPILLVEGEDDERIWQQAVRTSQGAIRLYPCICGDKDKIAEFEEEVSGVIEAIYENAAAYSLRDRGESPEGDLEDIPHVVRLKLSCYSAENLLLSDQVLEALGSSWDDVKGKIEEWLVAQQGKRHPHFIAMKSFKDSGFDRKNVKIKDIRNDVMGIIGSSKPWGVAVGQVMAGLRWDEATNFNEEGSIYNYLGEKTVKELIPKIKDNIEGGPERE